MSNEDSIESYKPKSSPFVLFGRDLVKIPCFKNTFLYSVSSWIGVSLLSFLVTSRPQIASHCGFASFMVVSIGYYFNCKMNYAKQIFEAGQFHGRMQKVAVMHERFSEKEELKEVEKR